MKDSPAGIAVIGSGYWGKNLVRNFAALGALRLICDTNETVLDVFREQYPGVETCLALSDVRPTLVKRGASLGANSTIVCGHTVGRYAFVGAGAVVTRDVSDHALVYGNPARPMGWVCACGEKLGPDLACSACGKTYKNVATGLEPVVRDDETL